MKLLCLVFVLCCISSISANLNELYRWKQLYYDNIPDYVIQDIPTDANLAEYADKTTYIPYNSLPLGVSHWKGKLFISVPRRDHGVPATVNVIDCHSVPADEKSPKMVGYPSYELNAIPTGLQPDPDRIISVYRTRVDVCDRLWIMDTGLLEYPTGQVQVQRPAVWVIDLNTNQRIRRFEIPESFIDRGDGFINVQVDADKSACDKAFAYVPNIRNHRLAVYSFEEDKLWTFGHNYFVIEPRNGDFNIQGFKFRWSNGIFSLALGAKTSDGYRPVYFHAFASLSEYVVSNKILQNSSLAAGLYQGDDFQYVGYRGENMQSSMHDIDVQSGIMFFAINQENAVGCWNTQSNFIPQHLHIVEKNDETMIFPSDVKVDEDSNVWVLSNKIPQYLYSRVDENDYNYRIFTNTVEEAIKGTQCGSKESSQSPHGGHGGHGGHGWRGKN